MKLGDGIIKGISNNEQLLVSRDMDVNYRLYLPRDYELEMKKDWPLVVFLHGAGQRGSDPNLLGMHGIPKEADEGREFPFIVLAPQCPEPSVWIMQGDRVMELLDKIRQEYRVDPERIYLTGISMGDSEPGKLPWSTLAFLLLSSQFAGAACPGESSDCFIHQYRRFMGEKMKWFPYPIRRNWSVH